MRLFMVAFLAIAAAISFNALYFQHAPQLAARNAAIAKAAAAQKAVTRQRATTTASLPGKPASAPPKPAQETAAPLRRPLAAAPAPVPAPTPAPAPSVAEPQASALVRSIQKKLRKLGYGNIPQNGLTTRETQAGILAVQFEQGAPLSGEPTEAVLSTLYFLEASGKTRLAPSERLERDSKLVAQVQDILSKLGYSSGPVNGHLDMHLRDAIRKFETDRQLKAVGRLTDRLLLEMVIETGKPFIPQG